MMVSKYDGIMLCIFVRSNYLTAYTVGVMDYLAAMTMNLLMISILPMVHPIKRHVSANFCIYIFFWCMFKGTSYNVAYSLWKMIFNTTYCKSDKGIRGIRIRQNCLPAPVGSFPGSGRQFCRITVVYSVKSTTRTRSRKKNYSLIIK